MSPRVLAVVLAGLLSLLAWPALVAADHVTVSPSVSASIDDDQPSPLDMRVIVTWSIACNGAGSEESFSGTISLINVDTGAEHFAGGVSSASGQTSTSVPRDPAEDYRWRPRIRANCSKSLPDNSLHGSDTVEAFGAEVVIPAVTLCGTKVATVSGTTGTDGDDVIVGTDGDDTIRGHGGNDIICARGGNDTIRGEAGDDAIRGEPGQDLLKGGSGGDNLFASAGDRAEGGSGADTLNFSGSSSGDTGELYGGEGNDMLTSPFGFGKLYGGGGHDTMRGGAEQHGGTAGDVMINGLSMYGGSGREHMRCENGALGCTMEGDSGNDRIMGLGGHDRMYGRSGKDRMSGGFGNDFMSGGFGNDRMYGEDGNDRIYGGRDDDRLAGERGNDLLRGQGQYDRVSGGPGTDDCRGDDENECEH